MKSLMASALAAGLWIACGSVVHGQVIDGSLDGSYGPAVSVQTIQTGFGDNASEWNAAYACMTNDTLSLMFTGNLESNFNKLEIFIDSSSAVTSNVFASAGNDGAGIMDGMTFDAGFTPDYHLIARRGFDGGQNLDKFDLDFAQLGANSAFSFYEDIGSGTNDNFSGMTGTGINLDPISVGFSNDNLAGIGGNAGDAADQNAALAVNTGLELSISLADLGNPTGPIRVMLLQNNDNHDFVSNQSLGGLPVGTQNLGSPASGIDFSSIAGDQFFTVNVKAIPEPITAGFLAIGVTALVSRRRR